MSIYTIGHSTRSLAEFAGLLTAHGITHLADVRSVPRSRRHPHFSIEALSASLPAAGITYRHCPGLGGLRKPRPDSRNTAWRHPGFRGYADYMATPAFEAALQELLAFAQLNGGAPLRAAGDDTRDPPGASGASTGGRTPRAAMMCAEAVWWKCHRQLIADALVARGVDVRHISSSTSVPLHALTAFARVIDGQVTYPGVF